MLSTCFPNPAGNFLFCLPEHSFSTYFKVIPRALSASSSLPMVTFCSQATGLSPSLRQALHPLPASTSPPTEHAPHAASPSCTLLRQCPSHPGLLFPLACKQQALPSSLASKLLPVPIAFAQPHRHSPVLPQSHLFYIPALLFPQIYLSEPHKMYIWAPLLKLFQ